MPNHEEQRRLVQIWAERIAILDAMHAAELRGMPYDWRVVDDLLQFADTYDGPERTTSGLVEMQRWFMKLHPTYFPQRKTGDDG